MPNPPSQYSIRCWIRGHKDGIDIAAVTMVPGEGSSIAAPHRTGYSDCGRGQCAVLETLSGSAARPSNNLPGTSQQPGQDNHNTPVLPYARTTSGERRSQHGTRNSHLLLVSLHETVPVLSDVMWWFRTDEGVAVPA